jgi:hypothetical protein
MTQKIFRGPIFLILSNDFAAACTKIAQFMDFGKLITGKYDINY